MKKYFDTEGERIIEFFLEDEGIKFEKQVKIPQLKEDYADYRVADFYMPKYKIYIEFLGKWNDETEKAKYHRKKEVYVKNNIPCIYVYPENLGALKYLFFMRLVDEFKNHPELKPQYIKYKLSTCSQLIGMIWLGYFFITLFVAILVNLSRAKLIVTPYLALLLSIILLGAISLTGWTIWKVFSKKIEGRETK